MNINLAIADFAALAPLLILLFGALAVLLLESFAESFARKFSSLLTLIIITAAFLSLFFIKSSTNPLLTNWLRFDSLARLFNFFSLTIGFGSTLLAMAFFKRFEASQGEYYFLLLTTIIGLLLIGDSADFLTLFLGLETLSISLYVLCGYMKKWEVSHEAAIKYFFTGAIATAILLYGIALIYGAVGTLRFEELLSNYKAIAGSSKGILFLIGIGLVTAGLAFKAAIVPFHAWAPDVYCGAPTPVTAFMSTGTKVGAFSALIIIFLVVLPGVDPIWNSAVAWLAYPTMIYANFVALRQTQLRRFFAYSGISHAGYLLIPLVAGGPEAIPALLFYLAIYIFATLGAFATLAFLDQRPEGATLKDLYGLFYRAPLAAFLLSFCLLTLAGIPPTAGFFAKFYVFKVGFQGGYYGLVIIGLLATVVSAFYYLRFVAVMFSEDHVEAKLQTKMWPVIVVGALSVLAILILSIYPDPLLRLLA